MYQKKFPKNVEILFVWLYVQWNLFKCKTFMLPIFQWEWNKSMFDIKEHEEKRNQTKCTQKFDEKWKNSSVRKLVQSRTQKGKRERKSLFENHEKWVERIKMTSCNSKPMRRNQDNTSLKTFMMRIKPLVRQTMTKGSQPAKGSHVHSQIMKNLQAWRRKENLVIMILLIKQNHNQVHRSLRQTSEWKLWGEENKLSWKLIDEGYRCSYKEVYMALNMDQRSPGH